MYETGTATGVVDLVNKLATFIEANGWTRDSLADEASGRRYHAHRSSQYLNMRAYVNEAPNSEIKNRSASGVYGVALNVGTGYNGATAWYKQAGAPTESTSYWTAGIIKATGAITAYHFFAHNSGDQIYAVIEYTSGKYQYFGWGQMSKFGTFTGGDFMFGSTEGVKTAFAFGQGLSTPFQMGSSSSSLNYISVSNYGTSVDFTRVDVDSETGWHPSVGTPYSASIRRVFDINSSLNMCQQYVVPNSVNAVTPLLPIRLHVARTAGSFSTPNTIQHAPIGELPSFFTCSIAALVPGQQITFGSENYRVFPTFTKGTSYNAFDGSDTSTRNAGYYGIAIKE